MSLNLIEAAKGLFTNQLIGQASSFLGESESGVSKAIGGIVPSLLSGITDKASTHEGANLVTNLANNAYASNITGNLGSFFGNNIGDLLHKGSGILTSLFGESKTNSLTSLISGFSDIRSSSASSLLSMVAPVVLGLIGKHAVTNNLNASGITSFLNSQKSNITNALPAGLNLNSFSGGFNSQATQYTREVQKEKESSKLLFPILLFLLIAGLIWYFARNSCNKPAEPVATTTTDTMNTNTVVDNTIKTTMGKIDSLTGDFIYDAGENVVIDLPNNTGKLSVGKNSTEYKLVTFLNDKSAMLDTVKGNWFEFTNVRFKTASSDITDESMEQLKNLVAISKAYPAAKFKIGGYTDNTGDPAANVALSQKRADAVVAMLKKLKIASAAIEGAKGYGEEWPIADNTTPEGRAQNRRVAVNVKAK